MSIQKLDINFYIYSQGAIRICTGSGFGANLRSVTPCHDSKGSQPKTVSHPPYPPDEETLSQVNKQSDEPSRQIWGLLLMCTLQLIFLQKFYGNAIPKLENVTNMFYRKNAFYGRMNCEVLKEQQDKSSKVY